MSPSHFYDLSAMRGDGQQYSTDQLVILGFPSREFGGQEYETDKEIADFAKSKGFPGILMKLGHVTGPGASEVWKCFMKATGSKAPNWNFDGKFLVGKTGKIILPSSDNLEAEIERLVNE